MVRRMIMSPNDLPFIRNDYRKIKASGGRFPPGGFIGNLLELPFHDPLQKVEVRFKGLAF
jgi:hypothetical protein